MSAFITAIPLRFCRPHLSLSLQRPLSPLPTPRTGQGTRPSPTCHLATDLSIAALSALTLGLSCLPLNSSPSAAHASSNPITPAAQLVVTDPALASRFSEHIQPVSVVGVAKAPIHEYQFDIQQQEASAVAALHTSANDASQELVLAARLITAVLLGAMVGIERRATRLNLGVRSITLLAISSALLFVVATCNQLNGIAVLTAAAAAPALPVAATATLSALGLYVAASTRPRPTKEIIPMCLVVGTIIAMGGACGAGLSLMSAGCYLAAIGIMRGTQKDSRPAFAGTTNKAIVRGDRELRVESEEGWDVERRMVFRIGSGQQRKTRVVEVGRSASVLSDGSREYYD